MWNWSFGDNTWQNGTNQNATHTYTSGGTYTVIEIASNAGSTNTTTRTNYITLGTYNQTLTGFNANVTSGLAPLAVGFNVTRADDNATGWNWSFGDGIWSNGTTQNVSHLYTIGGNFTIIEIAYNPSFSNSTTRTQYVNVTQYNQTVTGFSANTTSGIAPQGVVFNVSTPLDNATIWNWSFGDGIWQNGTAQNATHTYTIGGNFTIIEIASNPSFTNMTTRTQYVNISLFNQTITGFSANVTSGLFPLNVGFNVTNPVDNATGWNWSFGDGTWTNGTTRNVSHIYSTGGIYTVIEIAYNPSYSNSTTRSGYITVNNLTSVDFTGSNTSGYSPLVVNFTDSSSNATSWYWMYDGNTSTARNPTYIFTNVGSYTINHSASNAFHTSWENKTNYIVVSPLAPLPIVDFNGTPVSGPAPLSVQFTDNTTGTVTSWNWSFGDGTYSIAQNPSHIYTSDGSYTVTLAVLNGTQVNSSTRTNYIVVLTSDVYADFSATPLSGNYPLLVTFTDLSACDPACNAWSWDFDGDGSVDSIGQNPTYTYSYPLVYSPKLIASNGYQQDTEIKLYYISVGPTYIPTTIPQPTGTPVIGYRDDSGGSISFRVDNTVDLKNSTYLRGWLQNFSATGDFNIYGFATSIMAPLMHVFGFWIYLIIWALYIFAVWLRAQSVVLPLTIGIVSAGIFGFLFPKESLPVVLIIFVICGAIIVTRLLKDNI
jgi:PKD repeat protein